MRIAVTGTPGTGKTTAIKKVDTDLEVIHLNDRVQELGFVAGYDEERETRVADLEELRSYYADRDGVLFESHLAHHLTVDRIIVLRCEPALIESRLRERGESDSTATENAESEALDVILTEAIDIHGTEQLYEIDTTDRTPDWVSNEIEAIIADRRDPSAGEVSFESYL